MLGKIKLNDIFFGVPNIKGVVDYWNIEIIDLNNESLTCMVETSSGYNFKLETKIDLIQNGAWLCINDINIGESIPSWFMEQANSKLQSNKLPSKSNNLQAGMQVSQIETKGWLKPNDDISMQEAIEKIRKMGNKIVEVDHKNRKILVMHVVDKKI